MSISRRSFVERALAVAASAAAGGRIQAAEPVAAAAAKPVGPNDKIRVAVVGFNGRGLNHIAGWLGNPGAELVAWCDCDPGDRKSVV